MERIEKLNEILNRRISEQEDLRSQQSAEINAIKKNVLELEPRFREIFGIYGLLLKLGVDTSPINNGKLRIVYEERGHEYQLKDSASPKNYYVYLRTDRKPYDCDFGILTYYKYEEVKNFLLSILTNLDECERKLFELSDKFIEQDEREQRARTEKTFYVRAVFEVKASSESDAINKIWSNGKQTILRID